MSEKGQSETKIAEILRIPEYLIPLLVSNYKRGLSMRVLSHSDEIKLLERYHSGATGDELSEGYRISVGLIADIPKRHNQGLKRNLLTTKFSIE